MTPRERTVLRAVAKALNGSGCDEMDALALSYRIPSLYYSTDATIRHRATVFLLALVVDDEERR